MFNITFSAYGAAIAIFLVLMSITVIWIVGANIKYKNQDIKTSITTNSVKFSKMSAEQKKFKISFNIYNKANWWLSPIDVKRKIINVPQEAFNSTSIFYQVNTLFDTMLCVELSKRNKSFRRINTFFKILTFTFAINLLWMLTMSFWIGTIIFAALILISYLFECIYYRQSIMNAIASTRVNLITGASDNEGMMINKYLKYKKIIILKKYLSLFFEPLLSLFAAFKDWGKYE